MDQSLISKGTGKKRETRLIFFSRQKSVRSNRVFSLSRNVKINLNPLTQRSQENELLQQTHKILIFKSLVCAAYRCLVIFQKFSRNFIELITVWRHGETTARRVGDMTCWFTNIGHNARRPEMNTLTKTLVFTFAIKTLSFWSFCLGANVHAHKCILYCLKYLNSWKS